MIALTETATATECIHGENCPLHDKNPPFNAKVLAAIAEGDAIFNGEKPANLYSNEKISNKPLNQILCAQ